MRWKIPAAQAMLDLYTIHTNDDGETYQIFRITQETNRLHPHNAAGSHAGMPVTPKSIAREMKAVMNPRTPKMANGDASVC